MEDHETTPHIDTSPAHKHIHASHPSPMDIQPPSPVHQEPTSPPPPEDETLPLEYKLKSTDPFVLEKYVKLEKICAVNKKRAGDKAGALESVRNLKALEARHEQLLEAVAAKKPVPAPVASGGVVRNEVEGFRSSEVPVPQPPPSPVKEVVSSSPVKMVIESEREEVKSTQQSVALDALKQRQLEYKRAALEAKNAGDIPRARELLTVSKVMQETIDVVASGGQAPGSYTIPPPPSDVASTSPAAARKSTTTSAKSSPAAKPAKTGPPLGVTAPEPMDLSPAISASTTSAHSTPTSASASSPSHDLVTQLTQKITAQIALCTTISAHYFKSGQKDLALHFHRLKKTFTSDLDILSSLALSPTASHPQFTYKEISYDVEQANADLGVDEMEVGIVRAFGLGSREVAAGDVESFVGFEVGWPLEESGASGEGRGETGVVRRTGDPGEFCGVLLFIMFGRG